MDSREYASVVRRAAHALASLQLRRTKLRRELKALDAAIRDAKRNLKLVLAALEPYEPPAPTDPEERDG